MNGIDSRGIVPLGSIQKTELPADHETRSIHNQGPPKPYAKLASAQETTRIDITAAGGIVRDSHLPAYRKAGFPVAGIYDPDPEQAHARAREFGIPRVYESLEEAVSQENVIDLTTPPEAHLEVLQKIPRSSTVLIEKTDGA